MMLRVRKRARLEFSRVSHRHDCGFICDSCRTMTMTMQFPRSSPRSRERAD